MSSNTLDAYHKKTIKNIQKDNNKNKLLRRINSLSKELNKYDKDLCDYDDEIIIKINKLKREKKDLEKKVKDINNDVVISDYYMKTMDVLQEYFNEDNQVIDNTQKDKTIIEFIKCKNKTSMMTLEPFIKNNQKKNKKELFDKFLLKINTETINTDIEYVKNYTMCDNCNIEKIIKHSESSYICQNCGETTSVILEPEKPMYKENVVEICQFSYKRYAHYVDWLNKFQGLETTTIPREVFDKIKMELKKERITDISKINYHKIRSLLKPPRLDKNLENKLKIMFKKIKEPFEKFCPSDRKNFLSYSYVIRKFFELLDEKKYIGYFKYLKSREKLYQQDLLWKKICNELGWIFIPSI
jgi:hypothetical protein